MTMWDFPALMAQAVMEPQSALWILYAIVPGWLVLPLFHRLLSESSVAWYFAARVSGFAILGYLPWLLSHDAAAALPLESSGLLQRLAGGPGLFSHDRGVIILSFAATLMAGTALWWRWGGETIARIRRDRMRFILSETVFLVSFAFAGALRMISHGIVGQEKFMDMAFLRSCIDTGSMPPPDPWLYHLPINYYYGGYALFAAPAKLWGTLPAIAYNLSATVIFAMAACMTFAIGVDLSRRLGGGLLGLFLVMIAGNLSTVVQFAAHLRNMPHAGPFEFDWWAPSRVIGDQLPGEEVHALINEFPFFAAFHADLHPHFMAIPFGLLFAVLILGLTKSIKHHPSPMLGVTKESACLFLLSSWSLGLLLWMNPFDFLAWLLLAVIATTLAWSSSGVLRATLRSAGFTLFLVTLACIYVLPFLVVYDPPISDEGSRVPFAFTEFRTQPLHFILVWGLFIAISATWFCTEICTMRRRRQPDSRFLIDAALIFGTGIAVLVLGGLVAGCAAVALCIVISIALRKVDHPPSLSSLPLLAAAIVLLLVCELVYIQDSYGRSLQRMNTVFKFHFVAWIMIGLSSPYLIFETFRQWRRHQGGGLLLIFIIAFPASIAAVYPILAIKQRAHDFNQSFLIEPDYDGLQFLRISAPSDYDAIQWLNENAQPGDVILEAVGPPYGEYARISVFTPTRAVIGWSNHQNVWRGGSYQSIDEDIRSIYTSSDSTTIRHLIQTYKIAYVYIGHLERRDYPSESLDALAALFPAVFQSSDGISTIHQISPPEAPDR